MADRYDPKLSQRPFDDRRAGNQRTGEAPADDDPLVELARIVSGRSTFEERPSAAHRSTNVIPPPQPAPVPSGDDLARDLEAELLNELQASFSMLPEIVSKPAPATEMQSADAASGEDGPDAADETASDGSSEVDEENTRPAPLTPLSLASSSESRRESLADRIARRTQRIGRPEIRPPRRERSEVATTTRLPPPRSTIRAADEGDGREPPDRIAPPARLVSSRWEQPEADAASAELDVSRFAPRQDASDAPHALERFGRADQAPVHELEAFAADEEAALAPLEDPYLETPADEGFEQVPGYDDDLPPYPDEDLAAPEPPRRSRRAPLAIAAIFAVVLVGGASAVMLRSGGASDAPPPIITADSSPTKVQPEAQPASESEGQAKLIYDRVDPGTQAAESQLVKSGDQTIADIPPIPRETANNDVSRIILQGGPTAGSSGDETGNGAATADATSRVERDDPPAAIGPRRVRTVVVRPDGTIVSSSASEADGAESEMASAAEDPAAVIPPSSETPPAPGANENPLLAEDFNVATRQEPASSSTSTSEPAGQNAQPASPSTNTAVVSTDTRGTIDASPAAAPAGAGNFLIQVSSQRSQDVALSTFQALQQRYPDILGGRSPDIQRTDLGDRGVYYRVRVGFNSRDEALQTCENLKAAGGDCFLASP